MLVHVASSAVIGAGGLLLRLEAAQTLEPTISVADLRPPLPAALVNAYKYTWGIDSVSAVNHGLNSLHSHSPWKELRVAPITISVTVDVRLNVMSHTTKIGGKGKNDIS